jgi:integrase
MRMLPQRSDAGRALGREEEDRLLEAIVQSRSPALHPFFLLSLDAGLRPSETRALRRSNLRIEWSKGTITQGEIVVGRSKTDAGSGRVVPVTKRACAALTIWLSRFPDSAPEDYLFRFHRIVLSGNKRALHRCRCPSANEPIKL